MAKKTSNEDYEDQVRKEFESTQGSIEMPTFDEPEPQETFTNLGKVDFNKGVDINDDPDIKRATASMGYINIPLDTLPSGGRFYPENTRITIRAARVGEIREFSMIDETDAKDIRDKLTYIISQCCKVYFGNVQGYYKDLLEDDRIVLVLKIRELTFVDGQSSIKIPVPDGACSTPGCHPQQTVDFNSTKLVFKKPNEKIEKYYDPIERCYKIQTKRFGTITLYIPTIGVTSVLADWIKEQQRQQKSVEAPLVDLLPYLIKEWSGFSDKQVFPKISELAGWPTEKFALVLRLKEEISIGIEFEINETCAQCGGELKIPVTFPDGLKSLFVPTISDLGDELL